MDRQTLRDWVHRYNADGIAGLSDARRSGRPPALSPAQMEELKELVLAGPDLASDGVVRWRCIDLRSAIEARCATTIVMSGQRQLGWPVSDDDLSARR